MHFGPFLSQGRVALLTGALLCTSPGCTGACPAPPPEPRGPQLRALRRVELEAGASPVFVSGLSVDEAGRFAVTASRGEEGGYRTRLYAPGVEGARVTSAPVLTLSADDGALLGGQLWLAGQIDPHGVGSSLLRYGTGTATAAQAVVLPLDGAPTANRVRLALTRYLPPPGLLAVLGAVVEPAQRKSLGALVSVVDAGTAVVLQTVLVHEAESCTAADFAPPAVGGAEAARAWQLTVTCRAHDGAPLLVNLDASGAVSTARLDEKTGFGQALAMCLRDPSFTLTAVVQGHSLWLGACAGSEQVRRCTVARRPADGTAPRCLQAAADQPVWVERVAERDALHALAAGRNGGLWWFDFERGELRTLRAPEALEGTEAPAPALSPAGRYALYGRHGLDRGEPGVAQLLEVAP